MASVVQVVLIGQDVIIANAITQANTNLINATDISGTNLPGMYDPENTFLSIVIDALGVFYIYAQFNQYV